MAVKLLCQCVNDLQELTWISLNWINCCCRGGGCYCCCHVCQNLLSLWESATFPQEVNDPQVRSSRFILYVRTRPTARTILIEQQRLSVWTVCILECLVFVFRDSTLRGFQWDVGASLSPLYCAKECLTIPCYCAHRIVSKEVCFVCVISNIKSIKSQNIVSLIVAAFCLLRLCHVQHYVFFRQDRLLVNGSTVTHNCIFRQYVL